MMAGNLVYFCSPLHIKSAFPSKYFKTKIPELGAFNLSTYGKMSLAH